MKTFKRFLASLMVAVMVLTAAPLSGFVGLELNLDWLSFDWLDFNTKSSAAEDDVRGDVTNDGIINSSDALKVLQYVVKRIELIDEALHQADVNKDGLINSGDAVVILRIAVGLGNSNPPDTTEKAIFSLNLVEETDSKVVVAVKLESGSFAALDFGILANSAKIKKCEKININVDIALAGGVQAQNPETGLYGCAVDPAYDTAGGVIATYIFEKAIGANVLKNDFKMNVTNCSSEFEVVNKIGPTIPLVWSGTCGDNLNATLDSEGYLEISGTGNMTNYSSTSLPPWYDYKDDIKSIIIYNGATSIGNDTFVGCKNLTEVYIPDTVTKIGNTAFRDCTSLASIDIPASVANIGYYAFYGCTAFTSVNIPSGVTTIGNYAFGNCTGLTTVVIPDTVTTIAKNAFLKCSSLNNVLYTGTNEQWSAVTIGEGNEAVTDNVVIATAMGTCGANLNWYLINNEDLVISGSGGMYGYDGDSPWFAYRTSIKTISFVGEVTSIGSCAFSGCTGLTSITIPDSITDIGFEAFFGCSGLKELAMPVSAKIYNNSYTFGGCTNVEKITLTKGNGTAQNYSRSTSYYETNTYYQYTPWYISGCSEVIIEDGVTSIGSYTFSECTNLTSITTPDSVTSIGSYAFSGCKSLTNITIPDSVTSIGNYAFYNCSGIKELTMPISAKIYNSEYTFGGCTNIEKITLTKGNGTAQNYGTSTSSSATSTYYCYTPWYISRSSLKELTIEDGVTGIGSYAFSGCKSLTNITIPDSVTSIGYAAFLYCDSLASVTIGNSVTSIGDYAFDNCSGLKELTMPISAKIYNSEYTFGGCTNIEKITLTKGNGTAQNYGTSTSGSATSTYYGYTPWHISRSNLKELVIEGGVAGIGSYTFYGCLNSTKVYYTGDIADWLKISFGNVYANPMYSCDFVYINGTLITGDLVIPDSIASIGDYAFYNCKSLTSVTIPDSVTSIGSSAFYNCTGLTSVTVLGKTTSFGGSVFSNRDKIVLYLVKDSSAETYAKNNDIIYYYLDDGTDENLISVTVTPKLSFEINKGTYTMTVNCIGNMISFTNEDAPWYQYRGYIKHIVINDGCNNISDSAFKNMGGLESIVIPDSVTSIGSYAFNSCRGLKTVTIPDGVTSIGSSAFCYCTSLTSVTIGNSVTSIGSSVFYNCISLTSVTIGNGVTSIGSSAFSGCTSLTSITIPDGVTSIGFDAFSDCTSLTSITIPDSVTSIGSDAFSDCTSLTSITIGNSVTSIGSYAFEDCTSLTSITIPDSVTSIGYAAFRYCTSLTSITIGNSVTSIDNYAFYNCSGIKELTMPISAKIYNSSYTFYNCTNIEKITLTKGNGTAQNYTSTSSSATSTYYGYTPWYISRNNLKDIVIEDGVAGIGSCTFYYCTNLTSITIPDSVTSIGSSAFEDCTSLTSVTIGNSVTSIGSYAFAGCTGITDITVGNNVRSINANAFNGCTSLENITLPFALQSIGDNAFAGCSKLKKLKVYSRNCSFGTECISYTTTICGYAGSTAETYADEVGYFFELIPDDDHEHTYSNSCDAECNICGYVNLDAGHTYDNDCDTECNVCGEIRTPKHTDDNNDGLCDVCEKALSDILIGVEQNFKVKADETVYIKFVPANSGVYTFYSSSSTDTYGYIFNADKNTLASDDDSGGNGQFSITYTFKSGTVYYLGVRYYSSSNSGEIPVTIRLDELICDHNNTHEEHQDSTCTENGYDKVICDDCGQTVSMIELPLLDHDYKTITAPPTCVDEGTVVCLCKVCRDAYISEILDPLGHSELVWVTVKVPSTRNEGIMNQVCPACGEVFDTKTVPAISLSADSTANIDFETNTISGFNSGSSSIGDYLSATNNGYTFTCASEKIATGTVITLTAGEDMINEFEAVIFGDTNGDSWYDGQDAIIVDCLANGMLTKDDVSEAVYMAADCNHDGVIDQLDVDLLNEAGTLLANVDQSKPAEVLLETSSAYVEYISLIDQSPEIDVEDDTDAPEVDVETEDTTPEQDANKETNFFEMIMNFIKAIIEMILSRIPVPYK